MLYTGVAAHLANFNVLFSSKMAWTRSNPSNQGVHDKTCIILNLKVADGRSVWIQNALLIGRTLMRGDLELVFLCVGTFGTRFYF